MTLDSMDVLDPCKSIKVIDVIHKKYLFNENFSFVVS